MAGLYLRGRWHSPAFLLAQTSATVRSFLVVTKATKSKRVAPLPSSRWTPGEKLILHSPLELPGDPPDRQKRHTRSVILLMQWEGEMRESEWKQKKKDLNRRYRAVMKSFDIIKRSVVGAKSGEPCEPEKIADDLKATGLANRELLALIDRVIKRSEQSASPESNTEDLKLKNKRTRQSLRRSKTQAKIIEELSVFAQAANDLGDCEAATILHEVAQYACAMLRIVATNQPTSLKAAAANCGAWPILWDPLHPKKESSLVAKIGLGARRIQARFRPERAFSESIPARVYARALVEVMWRNQGMLPLIVRWFDAILWKGNEHFDYRLEWEEPPKWLVEVGKLPEFSIATVDQWAAAARTVLRAECPDFHLRDEWKGVRRGFGENERGRIQNKILDLIRSSMRTIAGEASEALPKSECQNSAS